jgi:WD40 repeat protein
MRELETFTQQKWGHIAFHSDSTGFRVAHTDLIYPNGIVNRDNHLYVSSCTGGSVYVFTINKDFTITLQEEILLDYIIDNLSFTPDGNLLTAGHPEGLKFGPHAKTLSQAPSMVTKIMIKKTEPRFEHVFYDNTGLMNASTTGLQLKENGKDIMFITGVLSRGVLQCD